MKAKEKIIYLESLRGIAALFVASFHYKLFDYFGYLNQNSWIFVEFFFVLSGFVISLNYQNKIFNFKNLIFFQKKRFLRLYPLHLLTLILMAIFYYKTTNEFDIYNLLINLLLLHNLVLEELTFNGPSWSISSEFYVYFIFGITVWLLKNKKEKIIFISIVFICLSFIFLLIQDSFETKFGFIRCMYSFFLGVIIFNITKFKNFTVPNFVLFFLLFLIIFSLIYFKMVEQNINFNILMPILFFLLIISLVNSQNNIIKKMLSNKVLVFLGSISYGIYMFHIPVSYYGNILFKILNFNVPTNINNLILNDAKGIIFLLITIFISRFSYIYFEKKIKDIRS